MTGAICSPIGPSAVKSSLLMMFGRSQSSEIVMGMPYGCKSCFIAMRSLIKLPPSTPSPIGSDPNAREWKTYGAMGPRSLLLSTARIDALVCSHRLWSPNPHHTWGITALINHKLDEDRHSPFLFS